jgi:hypothetical protein
MSEDWVELLWNNKISIFFYSKDKFLLFKPELYRLKGRKPYSETDENIFDLLKQHPEGLSVAQISKKLGIDNKLTRTHVKGPFGTMSSTSILKDKIRFKGKLYFI